MKRTDRRAAVLDEAIRIIGEQGFRGFSINELAKRCGLTTAGLLHHFGTKDGLLIALLEERDRRDQAAVASTLRLTWDEEVSRPQVLEVLRAIVSRNAKQPQLVRLYAMLRAEALIQDHPASDFFIKRDRQTLELFARIVHPHVDDPRATALQILSLMNGLEAQWLRDEPSFDLVAEWEKAAGKLVV